MNISYILAQAEYYTALFIKNMMQSLRPSYSMAAEVACSWSLSEMVERNAPDLILVDMQLADNLSVDVLKKYCRNVPIIAFSDDSRYERMLEGLNVVSIIYKPVSKESLAKALKRFEMQTISEKIK